MEGWIYVWAFVSISTRTFLRYSVELHDCGPLFYLKILFFYLQINMHRSENEISIH